MARYLKFFFAFLTMGLGFSLAFSDEFVVSGGPARPLNVKSEKSSEKFQKRLRQIMQTLRATKPQFTDDDVLAQLNAEKLFEKEGGENRLASEIQRDIILKAKPELGGAITNRYMTPEEKSNAIKNTIKTWMAQNKTEAQKIILAHFKAEQAKPTHNVATMPLKTGGDAMDLISRAVSHDKAVREQAQREARIEYERRRDRGDR